MRKSVLCASKGTHGAPAAGKRFRALRLCAIALLHNSLNRNRFMDKIMQPFKLLQRPLRLSKRRAAL
ncbi:hypothetical protein ELG83_22690 [Rhizobium leguminosarum]|nr:hypothetical protein ELG83_22690 [Rhizobium leguminosarum]